jgi:hypothetical protein
VSRSDISKEGISFEIVESSELSDSDIDILAQIVAKTIHRKLEQERSFTQEGDNNRDFKKEP